MTAQRGRAAARGRDLMNMVRIQRHDNERRNQTIAVLAGTQAEFDYYYRLSGSHTYIRDVRDLCGMYFRGHVVIGTFWERGSADQRHEMWDMVEDRVRPHTESR